MRMIYDICVQKKRRSSNTRKQSKNYQCSMLFLFFLSKTYLFMFAVYFCVSKAIDSDSRFVIQILSILSFYVPDFNKHKPNRNQKKNKIVLFANKLLNIIILKRKQNVSNCEYFKQNQSNANENERKKERDNKTEWNENSNKTDSKLWYMQHGTGTHSAQMSVFLKLVCGVSRFVYASINQWWLSVWRETG